MVASLHRLILPGLTFRYNHGFVATPRAGDTWRNIRDQLETIKVVEYERGGVHVQKTTEVRPAVAALLGRLKVELPPKIHRVTPSKTATPAEVAAADP